MENFSETLPCGLRMSVTYLPEGVGSLKEHQFEYLWFTESNKVHGRGFKHTFEEAKRRCRISAQIMLTESQIALERLK